MIQTGVPCVGHPAKPWQIKDLAPAVHLFARKSHGLGQTPRPFFILPEIRVGGFSRGLQTPLKQGARGAAAPRLLRSLEAAAPRRHPALLAASSLAFSVSTSSNFTLSPQPQASETFGLRNLKPDSSSPVW